MKKENAVEIIKKLKEYYPDATCSLNFKTPFQMAIAVLLSAQCTDERVNKVTKKFFKDYSTPEAISKLAIDDIERYIYSCGFYKNKAKNIKKLAEVVITKYNGKLPEKMEELILLPGIGRKSANVIMLEAYNNPQGIAIDTHAKRISNRLGLSKHKEPEKIEQDLLKIIPKEMFRDVNHLLVWHGRNICDSRNPKCDKCPINTFCNYYKKS